MEDKKARVTVVAQSREITNVERYLMTLSPGITSIKDVPDGTSIDVDAYIVFEDVKDDEKTSTITSVLTPDKKVYSAQSATFRQALYDIADCMGDAKFSVIKRSGTTKNGREFVTCELDVSKL